MIFDMLKRLVWNVKQNRATLLCNFSALSQYFAYPKDDFFAERKKQIRFQVFCANWVTLNTELSIDDHIFREL